jgi:hypothetical protein
MAPICQPNTAKYYLLLAQVAKDMRTSPRDLHRFSRPLHQILRLNSTPKRPPRRRLRWSIRFLIPFFLSRARTLRPPKNALAQHHLFTLQDLLLDLPLKLSYRPWSLLSLTYRPHAWAYSDTILCFHIFALDNRYHLPLALHLTNHAWAHSDTIL